MTTDTEGADIATEILTVRPVNVEGFWVLVGLGFAVGGLWEWLDIQLPLAPIVLIAVGVALLFWRVWPKSRRNGSNQHSTEQERHG